MRLAPDAPRAANGSQPAILQVRGLVKRFGALEVLKGIDFAVAPQELVFVIGPSGSGKSTLLRCCNRLEEPDEGSIVVDGVELMDPKCDLNAMRRRIGMVFQSFNLYPHLTALGNVTLALRKVIGKSRREADELGRAALDRVGLIDKVAAYPGELSGGQQQRVAIARALAMKPRVLLMDEPFSALDSPTRQRLHQDLVTLQQEERLTVVYVTHNLADAFAVGHRLAVMREGSIEQVGVPEDVRRNPANPLVLAALGIPED